MGQVSGGIVNLSTKGGSNDYHGEAYEYLRNKVLNSRGYFAPVNPPYVQNQFGGTFGGPVIKNKTFFFFGYDGYRQRTASTTTTTVPTADERNGVFPADVPIFDPLSVSTGVRDSRYRTSRALRPHAVRRQHNSDGLDQSGGGGGVKIHSDADEFSGQTNNYMVNSSSGGNTNQYVGARGPKTDRQATHFCALQFVPSSGPADGSRSAPGFARIVALRSTRATRRPWITTTF